MSFSWLLELYKIIVSEFCCYIFSLVSILPGRLGIFLRRLYYYYSCNSRDLTISIAPHCQINGDIKLGSHFSLGAFSSLLARDGGKLDIDSNVSINTNVMINSDIGGTIQIGKDTLIGPNVVIRSSEHIYADASNPIRYQGHKHGKIIIEQDVWICANCVITSNVIIGRGSIIAAGSVVTHNVEPYSVMGGVPAKVISTRV